MPNSFLDVALEYATKYNWPVFPIRARGKAPLTPRGFKDATTDTGAIRAWWSRWPDANIGLPTGEASGVVVVDIDCKDGKVGQASFEELVASKGALPDTVASNTSSGGRHLLFKCPHPAIKNSTNNLGQDIDTRGEGGYIVLPPSIHPSGEAYSWEAEPAHWQLADLPEWLVPAERESPKPKPSPLPRVTTMGLSDRMKRAEAYVNAMPPSISGSNGHNAAFSVATVLIHGFDLPEHLARSIFNQFNARCDPPWSEKEISHKLKQAATTPHDNPKGWLVDEEPPTDPVAEANAARLLAKMKVGGEAVTAPEPSAPEAFPSHLLQPPGYLGELTHWINQTAFKPQPVLALANSLAFMGALLGRKVRTASDLRSNLYCLGVGESGCGKDHSRKCIKKLCAETGLTGELLGGEELSSDSAILTAVSRNPSVLFQIDEIGHLFLTTNSRQAATYQRNIPVTLTKLYSSASTLYLGKEYADADTERKDIDQPCVCIYGTTVPGRLYDGITTSEIRDGFLGRNLVFQSGEDDPEPVDPTPIAPPAGLIEMAAAWWQRDTTDQKAGNIAKITKAHQIVVREQEDAKRVFVAFRHEARSERARVAKSGGALDSLWSRAEENARKVALIVACGCEFGGPVVGKEIAEYAVALVDHLVRSLVTSIEHHVSDTDFGRKRLMVLNGVRNAGPEGISKSDLARLTKGMRGRERDEILDELLLSGEIEKEAKQTDGVGRPATVYRIN